MAKQAQHDYQLQDAVYRLLQERPEYERYLAEMVEWEDAHPPKDEHDSWSGWEWQDVHTPIGAINSLITWGLVDLRSKSRSYSHYRLRSVESTREALNSLFLQTKEEIVSTDQLFDLVVGHDNVKALLVYAVLAERPVHALLVGPPGTAKTLLLSDIGSLPGAQFYVGSTTTKSGLVGLLLSTKPRYLVIDELDKMTDQDMSPLLNLMETGMVTRLQHGVRDRVTLDTRVFAGANDARRISPAIMSRFATFEIPPYSPQDFVRVAIQVLIQREGLGPEMAKLVVNEVVRYSTDVRDAVRVARMAKRIPHQVVNIVDCLWGQREGRPAVAASKRR
jgi:Holliday junction DNA helicase RuvB